jgi:hypothetical protein
MMNDSQRMKTRQEFVIDIRNTRRTERQKAYLSCILSHFASSSLGMRKIISRSALRLIDARHSSLEKKVKTGSETSTFTGTRAEKSIRDSVE